MRKKRYSITYTRNNDSIIVRAVDDAGAWELALKWARQNRYNPEYIEMVVL